MTSVHNPFDNRILNKECRSLVQAGYGVTLLAPIEEDQEFDGVIIRSIPSSRNRLDRLVRTHPGLLREAIRQRADVYHFHDPELIWVGLVLRMLGKSVVYDSHEDLRKDIKSKYWVPPRLRGLVGYFAHLIERLGILGASAIVAATPAIERNFPAGKTVVVQNFPRVDEIEPGDTPHQEREPLVAYVGGLRVVRGVWEMLKASELLPESVEARFELGGTFMPPGLEHEVREMPGARRCRFLGWQNREEVIDLLKRARVGLALLHPIPNFMEAQPTKIYEYMAAGIPVVASDFPFYRTIVTRSDAGLLVDPLDPQEIADAIAWLLTHPDEAEQMGRKGREMVMQKYNWDVEAARLVSLYDRLTNGDGAR